MVEQVHERIWRFKIRLPDNPLKSLNCYAVRGEGGGRNLLIDSGFHRPECLADLKAGMAELGLEPDETDVFFTHIHSDHIGNACELAEMGCRLFAGRIDYAVLRSDSLPERMARAVSEGMAPDVLRLVFKHNPATLYAPGPFEAETLEDGDLLRYGGYTLRCVLTPGHTPGHMCLYDEAKRLMFTGDHVLFDITPNIAFWTECPDALGDYLESLERIKAFPVDLALTAHRKPGEISLGERIDELIAHHAARLAETERIVRESPGLDAYRITGKMSWRIRAKNWDEFPPGQKWFAVGEALTHLDYLVIRGRVHRGFDMERCQIVYHPV